VILIVAGIFFQTFLQRMRKYQV